ncbi:MAG: LTA synthase family protein [Ruminococcaceae bacterium]|nr:LTA synthase family protein [Oscillospiraceae bacterium]
MNHFYQGAFLMAKTNMKNPNSRYTANSKNREGASGRIYLASRKIPLTLLLSLTLPLTVCFFGPFETYCGNIGEFLFSLGDFFPLCIAFALAVSAVLFVILMLLDGVAYDITAAILVWLSVMAFAQRYYLNLGVNALVGDGVGVTEAGPMATVLNLVLWLVVGALVIAAAVLLKKKNIAPFFVSCAVVLIVVLATQTVGFAALSFSTDVYVPVTERVEEPVDGEETVGKEPSVLTFENLNELSGGRNVVFFLIDRFDVRYFEKLQKTEPEYLDGLGGFTFYNDYTSLYCRTYPAVASILTGKENDFSDTRLNYFKDIYTDGGYLRELHNNGYNVNVYTEKYYVYDDASYMSGYVDNISGVQGYTIDSNARLSTDMLRLSMSTCLPFTLKSMAGYLSTPDFNAHAVYESDLPEYNADMKDAYEYITQNEFVKVETRGQFSFIHLFGCHTPVKYNLNWEEADERERSDTTMALKQSLTIIYEYIEQMKSLGVYEDATIVITGDHPAAISDTKLIGQTGSSSDNGTRVTAMLFKRAGESGTELKTSTAQISQDQLWATIYESEGLTALKKGESFFDIPEGEDRVRRYLFEMSVSLGDERADEIVEYRITGSARVAANWEILKRTTIGKIYK